MRFWRRRYNPYSRFRRNPDRGPTLYNPLEDDSHPFKNDAAYKKIIKQFYSKNRKYRRNPEPFYYGAGEDTQQGLYGSLFRHKRRRMSRRRNPGATLYKSIYAGRRHRKQRNPFTRNPDDDLNNQIFSQDIFARRRNPIRHKPSLRRHNPFNTRRPNPFGYYELSTYDSGDAYWDRGRV